MEESKVPLSYTLTDSLGTGGKIRAEMLGIPSAFHPNGRELVFQISGGRKGRAGLQKPRPLRFG